MSAIVGMASFWEEIDRQFIFINFDEVNPSLWLAESATAAHSLPFDLLLILQPSHHSAFPPGGLLKLHPI